MRTEPLRYDKDASIAVKGLAVLLMILLHFGGWQSRNGYLLDSKFIGHGLFLACGVCVSIYVFIAGYAAELKTHSKCRNILFKYNLRNIKKLYLKFLSIAIPILSIIYIFGLVPIETYGYESKIGYDIKNLFSGGGINLIYNLLLLKSNYCGEWWFLSLYFELLLLHPFLPRPNKLSRSILIWSVLFAISITAQYIYINCGIFSQHIWQIFAYISTFYLGMIFSRYKIFEIISKFIPKNSLTLCIIAFAMIMFIRSKCPIISINNNLWAPLIILTVMVSINKSKRIYDSLIFFGGLSTEIWLCHSFFIYYGFYKIAYISTNPLIVLPWIIILSIGLSLIFKLSYNSLNSIREFKWNIH